MSYNGWKNYQTWNVALWIDNEESSYSYRCQLAERAKLLAEAGDESASVLLSDMLKTWISDANPLINAKASVYNDLLTAALDQVDWMEIATNFLDE